MILAWFKRRRRQKILQSPFPRAWLTHLEAIAAYRELDAAGRARLQRDVQVFVAEKNWEGCSGLELTDEIKVTVAAYACLMILGLAVDEFDRVLSILVYPSGYAVPFRDPMTGRIMPGVEHRLGEAWYRGPVIMSWADVKDAREHPGEGRNLVWHEFAHQLDMLDRESNGTPPLTRQQSRRWAEVMYEEFDRLRAEAKDGKPSLLDNYGTKDEAEFFAVTSECFFDRPQDMRAQHPRLYDLLADYYRQDPAARARR